MSIQKQDLYGGNQSIPPQTDKTSYITWCNIKSIQGDNCYGAINLDHSKMIKNYISSNARLWASRNTSSMMEADQHHSKILKHTTSNDWCQIMSIQEQDFYDVDCSNSFQHNQKHCIKWCQSMSIQK